MVFACDCDDHTYYDRDDDDSVDENCGDDYEMTMIIMIGSVDDDIGDCDDHAYVDCDDDDSDDDNGGDDYEMTMIIMIGSIDDDIGDCDEYYPRDDGAWLFLKNVK